MSNPIIGPTRVIINDAGAKIRCLFIDITVGIIIIVIAAV